MILTTLLKATSTILKAQILLLPSCQRSSIGDSCRLANLLDQPRTCEASSKCCKEVALILIAQPRYKLTADYLMSPCVSGKAHCLSNGRLLDDPQRNNLIRSVSSLGRLACFLPVLASMIAMPSFARP